LFLQNDPYLAELGVIDITSGEFKITGSSKKPVPPRLNSGEQPAEGIAKRWEALINRTRAELARMQNPEAQGLVTNGAGC
jgi:hypothetical protein